MSHKLGKLANIIGKEESSHENPGSRCEVGKEKTMERLEIRPWNGADGGIRSK